MSTDDGPQPAAQGRPLPGILTKKTATGLGSQVRSGVMLTTATRFTLLVLQIASTAVLARLLSPGDYGLAALVAGLTGFAAILVDLGIASSVIQRPVLTSRYLSTAFWFNAGAGATFAVIVASLSIPLSIFFHEPQLVGLTLVASCTFLLTVDAVPIAIIKRSLSYRALARTQAVSVVMGITGSVLAAFLGAGAYSLVVAPVLQQVASIAQTVTFVRWLPRLEFAREDARDIWRFGRGLTGYFAITYWGAVLDRFIIGKLIDVGALGQYNRASNLIILPMQQTTQILSSVFYPAFATMQNDIERLQRAWLRLVFAAWTAGLPVGVLIVLTSEDLVAVLYGSQWDPVTQLLTWMSPAIVFTLLSSTSPPVFEALDRTGLQFRIGLGSAGAGIVLLAIAAPLGLHAIAGAFAARAGVSATLNITWVLRELGLKASRLVRTLARSTAAVALMAAAVILMRTLVSEDLSPVPGLVIDVALGGTVFGGVLVVFERRMLGEVLGARARKLLRVA